ncbi:fumarate hydratase [Myxococcota bacterium]|nr:fumarate hydratase [Myxococcota bacterium]MBU1411147.1 fumarate hydratase [Myxococcota bacterium]MBU1509721.1 fumarate hydratase [Myxococcota bacterium]
MRELDASLLFEPLRDALLRINVDLPDDVVRALMSAAEKETGPASREVLSTIVKNIGIAKQKRLPLCQDTGMVWLLLRLGEEVVLTGEPVRRVIHRAVEAAYTEGLFRKSVVADPLFPRTNTKTNLPPVLHVEFVPGDRVTVAIMTKGFGSENKSGLRMLLPTATPDDVMNAIVEIVRNARGAPCPPTVIGVGLGGTMDAAALLSKKALVRELDDVHPQAEYADMERELLSRLNALGIGAGGLGGITTCLGVKIASMPTHIAGMPVAVTVNCWADRKAVLEL